METAGVWERRRHEFPRSDERSIPWRRCYDDIARRWKDCIELLVAKVAIMLILHHDTWRIHDDGDHRCILAGGSWRCVPARAPLFGYRGLESFLRPFSTNFLLLSRLWNVPPALASCLLGLGCSELLLCGLEFSGGGCPVEIHLFFILFLLPLLFLLDGPTYALLLLLESLQSHCFLVTTFRG